MIFLFLITEFRFGGKFVFYVGIVGDGVEEEEFLNIVFLFRVEDFNFVGLVVSGGFCERFGFFFIFWVGFFMFGFGVFFFLGLLVFIGFSCLNFGLFWELDLIIFGVVWLLFVRLFIFLFGCDFI